MKSQDDVRKLVPMSAANNIRDILNPNFARKIQTYVRFVHCTPTVSD
jgi:hypothetical protein